MKPFYIWPACQYTSKVENCLSYSKHFTQALEESPDIFGLSLRCTKTQDNVVTTSPKIEWLQVDYGMPMPCERETLSTSQKEAVIDLTLPRLPSLLVIHYIQNTIETMPLFSEGKEITSPQWFQVVLCREGILISRNAVRRAGKSSAWTEAFKKEEYDLSRRQDKPGICKDDLYMGRQACTLHLPLQDDMSSHEKIAHTVRLKALFQLHFNNINTIVPKDRIFKLHPEWCPPRY